MHFIKLRNFELISPDLFMHMYHSAALAELFWWFLHQELLQKQFLPRKLV